MGEHGEEPWKRQEAIRKRNAKKRKVFETLYPDDPFFTMMPDNYLEDHVRIFSNHVTQRNKLKCVTSFWQIASGTSSYTKYSCYCCLRLI